MKKLLALILVLTLVLSMGITAFAVVIPAYEDWSPVTINKEIKLTNEGTINPAETFNFTIGAGVVTKAAAGVTAPAFDTNTFDIDIAQGILLGSDEIVLPEFGHVGVYTYPITEIAGSTAGFDYDDGTYYLVVTVINNPDYVVGQTSKFLRVLTLTDENNVKRDSFENDFSAGSLVINKKITGNYALFDDEFEVTVTLTPDQGKNIKKGPISVSGAVGGIGSVADPDADGKVVITFKVTHESEVTIANIPYGVSYVITEDSGDYESNIPEGGFIGTIGAESYEVDIVNKLDTEISTGINLDNLPYILILVGAAVGLVAFTMKRRLSDDR